MNLTNNWDNIKLFQNKKETFVKQNFDCKDEKTGDPVLPPAFWAWAGMEGTNTLVTHRVQMIKKCHHNIHANFLECGSSKGNEDAFF